MTITTSYGNNTTFPPAGPPRADREIIAAADSGATHTMVRPDDATVLLDKRDAVTPLRAITADGGILTSTHEGQLPLKGISRTASLAHVMPGLQTNLVSLGQLCNDGLEIVLTRDDLRA